MSPSPRRSVPCLRYDSESRRERHPMVRLKGILDRLTAFGTFTAQPRGRPGLCVVRTRNDHVMVYHPFNGKRGSPANVHVIVIFSIQSVLSQLHFVRGSRHHHTTRSGPAHGRETAQADYFEEAEC